MGLFWRKKARIERERLKRTHRIVCLHCFRGFSHEQVMFRALEALDAEGYAAARDEELDGHRARFGLPSAGELEAALDPGDFAESAKGHRQGVLVSLRDDYGNVTERRICPYCHNPLPQAAGFQPPLILAVTGQARAGKSTFFTCLIHHIRNSLPRHYSSHCASVDGETGRFFKESLAVPLLENGTLPVSALLKEFPDMPIVFNFALASAAPDVSIVLFDPAGDSGYMDIHAHIARSASGIMLLVDPVSIPGLGKRLAEMNDPGFDPLFFTETVDDFGLMLLEEAQGANVAVVLTKTDMLKAAGGEAGGFGERSAVFSNYFHRGFFDAGEHAAVDAEVHNFLAETCPNFFNAIKKRHGSRLGFFGVSALGQMPVAGQVSALRPVRIGEPFLWLLAEMGLVPSSVPGPAAGGDDYDYDDGGA